MARRPRSGAPSRPDAHAAVAALGARALIERDVDAVLDQGLRAVAAVLDVELVGFLEARPERDAYAFRAGLGWRDGVVGATVPASRDAALNYLLRTVEPVTYEDLSVETRFEPPQVLLDHGVRGGIGVVIDGPEQPYGVLGVHTRARRHFTTAEVNFLQGVGNVLGLAIERERHAAGLREREERFGRLAENAQDLIIRLRLRPVTAVEYANPAVGAVLGYSVHELEQQPSLLLTAIHPEDRDALLDPGPDPTRRVVRARACDGTKVWLDVNAVPVRDERGSVAAVECIARDVTFGRERDERLRQAYEREHAAVRELRQLDAMKNAFLQAVSHELRTPLTALVGFAATLETRSGELSPADREHLIARLAINARELDRLLADLLDLDRLVRRTIEPRRAPVKLRALVETSIARAELGSRAVSVEGEEFEATLDGPKVERIVDNLLANASRHTPTDARVWVRVATAGDGALITVADDGPGVADELKESIFEPFRQGPTERPYDPGAGIGLSLVARFAELHGGRAWVEDRPGGGAAFNVLVPGEAQASSA